MDGWLDEGMNEWSLVGAVPAALPQHTQAARAGPAPPRTSPPRGRSTPTRRSRPARGVKGR